MIIKNKTGFLGIPSFIVYLIIAIITLIVFFLFYTMISWKGTIDKDACSFSALQRATVPELAGKKLIELPMKCQTQKICIAGNFLTKIQLIGGCKEFKGEKNIKVEPVDSGKKGEGEIKKIIADAMYDCWEQLYKGDNNLFDRSWSRGKIYCGFCSRIAFDEKAKKEFSSGITGMADFLKTEKISNSGKTYYQHFFQTIGNFDSKKTEREIPINPDKQYAITYDIFETSSLGYVLPTGIGCATSAGVGLSIGGAITAVPVVGWIVGPTTGVAIFAAGCIQGSSFGEKIDNFFNKEDFTVAMNLKEYKLEDLEYCDEAFTIP